MKKGKNVFGALLLAGAFLLAPSATRAQLIVNSNVTPAQLVANLVGQGLQVSNIVLNCPPGASGTFNGTNSNIGLANGILLTSGNVNNAVGPNNTGSSGTCNNVNFNDPQLTSLEPMATYDPCILEFDVIPQCSSVVISFVFGSEEYPEFVNSSFNDAFGFFITGPNANCNGPGYNNTNVATLPNNVTIVSIDNVNANVNSQYYFNNTGGATIQYDGFTVVLTRTIMLCPCQPYHFKIAIADAGDCIYDSGVFLDYMQCQYVLAATTSSTTAGCTCAGTATATITAGVGPFTYVWAPGGQTTATATGLCPGTYTVTIDDGVSCSPPITQTVVVSGSGGPTVTVVPNSIAICSGACTPLTASGATTYTWSPATGLSATTGASVNACPTVTTTYTVTGTTNNCSATSSVTVTVNNPATLSMSQTNVPCNGGCNGSATVSASGGNTPYTYSWAPSGGNAATATGLCAGVYTVTVTTANGCTRTSTVTITQPTALSTIMSSNPASCGGSNGTATVSVLGGTPGYSYLWSTGASAATATGLAAGNYTVTVTDANGCTTTAVATVTTTNNPTASMSYTDVTCFNACNGIATVTPVGNAPFTFSWAPSGGSAATASNLCPGTYTVTCTDANGCTVTSTVTIIQPTPVSASVSSVTDVSCFGGNNGSATVAPSGGTPTYTYSWMPSGGNAATATGLSNGIYTVTVTDANGCTATITVTINEPTALTLNVAGFSATCFGSCDGMGVCIPSGGVGNYTFLWTPGNGTNASITGLCVGVYTVIVSDGNGCTASDTAVVNQPPSNVVTTTQVDNLCNSVCAATSTATTTGGSSPYLYSWSTVPVQTTQTATGLCAGTYTVVSTDANGCSVSTTVTILQPAALTAALTQVNITCNGNCNGSANVVAGGGTPGYSYLWMPGGQTTATASGLCAGSYTVTVTDANGCTIASTVTITQPPVLTVNASASPAVVCIGQSSTLTAVGAGGNPNYTYAWAPVNQTGTTVTLTPSTTTIYIVTTTDANGCTASSSITVTVNPLPVVTFVSNPSPAVGCAPLCVDFINNTPNSVNCDWNFSIGTSNICNPTFCFNTAGTYDVTLTVTDNNGCVNSLLMPAYVIVYPVPVADFSMNPQPTTFLNATIQFTDLSTGSPNQWQWSFGDVLNSSSTIQNPVFTYTDSGSFWVELIVVNQYGCRDTVMKGVRIDPDFTFFAPNAFTPDGNGINDIWYPKGMGVDDDKYQLWIFDRWGNNIFYTDIWTKGWDGKANGGSALVQEDVYIWKVILYDIFGKKHTYIGHVTVVK
jgi:gliding motility-associated-like protein